MPLKDPEARREYDRARRERTTQDPVALERRRALGRETAKRRRRDPVSAQKLRDAQARWEAKNGEAYRAIKLANRYGITPDEYQALVVGQNGTCAICLLPERVCDPRSGRPRALAVDHDHATKRVRGLLCYRCNKAIGILGEDRERLARAISYLEEP